MKANKKDTARTPPAVGADFFEHMWEHSWTYIKTVVDVVHEPILILNKDLCVTAANESFYTMFRVEPKDTEGNDVYKLGNGQWNIPTLRNLLENILPRNTFFKGFEVTHEFPLIGRKVMILNARQIFLQKEAVTKPSSSIILLAIEDVTEMMAVAKKLSDRTNWFEEKMTEQREELGLHIKMLEKEIIALKRKD